MFNRNYEYDWIIQKMRGYKSKVLDIGCIRKKLSDSTIRLLSYNFDVTGIDFQKLDKNGISPDLLKKFTFIQGDILKQEFEEESFDYVVASHVLQHMGLKYWKLNRDFDYFADQLLVEKIYKWLKPNGKLFVVAPICEQFQYLEYSEECVYRVYSKEHLCNMFEEVGFELMNYETCNGAHDTKKKIKNAMVALMELRKE